MDTKRYRVLSELYRMQPEDHQPTVPPNATVAQCLRVTPSLTSEEVRQLEQYVVLLNELPDAAARARVIDCIAHEWSNDPAFVPMGDPEKLVETFMNMRSQLGARLKGKEADTFRKILGRVPLPRFTR